MVREDPTAKTILGIGDKFSGVVAIIAQRSQRDLARGMDVYDGDGGVVYRHSQPAFRIDL